LRYGVDSRVRGKAVFDGDDEPETACEALPAWLMGGSSLA